MSDDADHTPPSDADESGIAADRRRAARLALLGCAVAVVVAVGSLGLSMATKAPSEAVVSMALDEREVGWPFYGAAQEKAAALFDDADFRAQVEAEAAGVDELDLQRPGDLSLLKVVASAGDDRSALTAATAAAEALLAWSEAEQRALLDDDRALAADRVSALDTAVQDLQRRLDSLPDETDPTGLRTEMEARTFELTDARLQLEDLDRTIAATGPEYRVLAAAEIVPRRVPTLLSSLATGLGAGVLAVLAAPMLSRRR